MYSEVASFCKATTRSPTGIKSHVTNWESFSFNPWIVIKRWLQTSLKALPEPHQHRWQPNTVQIDIQVLFEHSSLVALKIVSDLIFTKVGGVFPMVIWSEFRMEQHRDDDHQEDTPYFNILKLFIKWHLLVTNSMSMFARHNFKMSPTYVNNRMATSMLVTDVRDEMSWW